MQDLDDIFKTDEFKLLPWRKRFWIRLKVAFLQTLTMF